MDDLKNLARAAKHRLKTDYWASCVEAINKNASEAKDRGVNENKVKRSLTDKVKRQIKGEKPDEFYEKVKRLLDTEGEVSDAIGRLTDREIYDSLGYEEKQRYTLDISNRYIAALQKYKKEKELGLD